MMISFSSVDFMVCVCKWLIYVAIEVSMVF